MPFKNIKDVTKAKDTSSILVIGKGVLFSFLISAVLLVIYGILLTVTSLSETSVPTVIMIITMISIALSSIYTAVRVDSRGWLNGAIVGFVYMLVLFLIGLIFNTGVTLDSFIFFRLLMGFVIGALAGIIGINIK